MSYSFASRLLHRFALGSDAILETTFDIERKLFPQSLTNTFEAKHVFVCGLARAGTTVLMKALYDSSEFSSLTFRDMPFVLAPNTWARVTKKFSTQMDDIERAHGDGIKINFDSPEALEEIFWRVFGGNYIHKDRLSKEELDDEAIKSFQAYVNLINHRYNKNRYLSKNNNNILRLSGLLRAFPNAKILVPFRDPIQHAQSLLTQHQRFIEEHRHDRFTQKYMTWLVHHEFGSDHRPFEWGIAEGIQHQPTELEYWLQQWVATYRFLINEVSDSDKQRVFVCYELLCEQSRNVWNGICKLVEISPHYSLADNFNLRNRTTNDVVNSSLRNEAYSIYEALKTRSQQHLLSR